MGVNSDSDELGSNAEYLPTKCRITRPPPPKPATNPLQFVKVGPCPLNKKAQEQVKKAEEIKIIRQEVREEAEDWQHNLDNWKSSRRKRQEHIIERVEEVKKLEQKEHERGRRRSSTFSEIVEKRSRGRTFNIPIYDDDSNDLSDYGIGSSSSKTNSIKDVDTDDNSSILDDKDNVYDSACNTSGLTNKTSNSEDELQTIPKSEATNYESDEKQSRKSVTNQKFDDEQYTYEGAIQDYRSRIRTKININESVFNTNALDTNRSKEFSEAQNLLPKGNLFKRKEIFEAEKTPIEINSYESNTSRRLSEDFANSQSIKERLQSLEKCTDQSLKSVDKNELPQGTVKSRLQKFNNKISDFDTKNNNNNSKSEEPKFYLPDKSSSTKENKSWSFVKNDVFDTCSSAEEDIFNDKHSDTPYGKSENGLDEFMSSNYPPSTSSTDLMALSSDREDSGIHTADVSCSVSQSDEAFEETEFTSNTIPKCIEKLNNEKLTKEEPETVEEEKVEKPMDNNIGNQISFTEFDRILSLTFLNHERNDSSQNLEIQPENKVEHSSLVEHIEKTIQEQEEDNKEVLENDLKSLHTLDLTNYSLDYMNDEFRPKMQPPSEKPPPLPPMEVENEEPPPNPRPEPTPVRRLNSTKRIKKELHIKRSSFLGLDEPTDDQIDPDVPINKPPDINTFLQQESRLEKSRMFKTLQERELELEESRKSMNKMENNIVLPKDNNEVHAINSDEDELRKKEQEIIELVEKEEKTKDYDVESENNKSFISPNNFPQANNYDNLGSKKFDRPYFPETQYTNLEDHDSEVLKVEHELLQLEREELERQRENILFREKSAKIKQNRHSYENICDVDYYTENFDYRKSMPELQQIAVEYRNPPVFQTYSKPVNDEGVQYRKSMPDIQHAYNRPVTEYCSPNIPYDLRMAVDHRKSMPELQMGMKSAFSTPPPHNTQPIMPGKPIKPVNKEQKERFMQLNPTKSDALFASKQTRPISKHSLHALSAVPKSRHITNDNWIRPKANPEVKNYNQHWLYQEAELRRISEQKNSVLQNRSHNEPGIPFYNNRYYVDSKKTSPKRLIRPEPPTPKEYSQHPYLNHSQTGHALPMPYGSPATAEEGQDVMLSVSGKKKCSYCGNELGRGAAMIIESLCLFYHMECFKCCVCHMELGDGLMGTDVRVRNQKLHCHNCYSSDDGIKFSCV